MKLRAYIVALHAALFAILLAVQPAGSGSMSLMGAGKPAAAGGGPLTFAQTDSGISALTPAPGFTYTTKNVGTGSATRVVWVALDWRGTNSTPQEDITSVSVDVGGGAIPMTQAVYQRTAAVGHGIWYVLVTGGAASTATITVGGYTNGFVDQVFMQCGTITGSATASHVSPVTSAAYPASTSAAVTVPTNGVAIVTAMIVAAAAAGGETFTWTGTASGSPSGYQTDGSANGFNAGAGNLTASATVNITPGGNYGGAYGFVGVGFQP